MKFISLFSGVGGFDLGFERAGMECVLQVEIDKHASAVLGERWPNVQKMEDVNNVKKANTPAADLICGGFPCQDLSVAGKRAGLAGEKSGLWYQFARIIEELSPRWVVIENVPGLLSSNKGRDMGILTGKLAELGYWWAYRVLDSQYFGVAQRRRRVFIVANLRDATSPTKVLFEPESGERDTPPSRETGEGDSRVTSTLSSSGSGMSRPGGQGAELGFYVPVVFQQNTRDEIRKMNGDGKIAGALAAEPGMKQQNYLAWHENQGVGVRRLTPTECERLQGFPDGWTAEHSDAQRYKMMGNAVTVNVAEWIGERIMAENASK